MKSPWAFILVTLGFATIGWHCSPVGPSAGIETGNPEVTGKFVDLGGTPVAGAVVRMFTVDNTPLAKQTRRLALDSDTTDGNGIFRMSKPDAGWYNIEGATESLGVFIDSIAILDDTAKVELPVDTLKRFGAIMGISHMEGRGDTDQVRMTYFIPGTHRIAIPAIGGTFVFHQIPEGEYQIIGKPDLDDYGVKVVHTKVLSGDTTRLDTVHISIGQNPDTTVVDTTVETLTVHQAKILGHWVGTMEFGARDPLDIHFIFNADNTYSAYPVQSSSEIALYWGSNENSPAKRYELTATQADGHSSGTIVFYFASSSTHAGTIQKLRFSRSYQDVDFELWKGIYGPLVYRLTKRPIVTGLKANYDPATGTVTLEWNKSLHHTKQGYKIYKSNTDSLSLADSAYAVVTDTVFSDTIFKSSIDSGAFSFADTNDYRYRYGVVPITENSETADTCSNIFIVALSPTKTHSNFQLATRNAEFVPRSQHTSLAFNEHLWVISGRETVEYVNDIWKSSNGTKWEMVTASPGFAARKGHASVVFDNKMWVIGGEAGSTIFGDVWYSSNGVTWHQATSSPGFGPRTGHSAIVYNNKIWVIGGYGGNSDALGDVWYSSDGITWQQAVDSAGFQPRFFHGSVVFDNKMWVIGGGNAILGGQSFNDTWTSSDGVTWTHAGTFAAVGTKWHTATVFNDKIYLVGGFASLQGNHDVYYLDKGATSWAMAPGAQVMEERYGHAAAVFKSALWVIGGKMNFTYANNEVWYLH